MISHQKVMEANLLHHFGVINYNRSSPSKCHAFACFEIFSCSKTGGIAHLFDVSNHTMLDFAPKRGIILRVASIHQRAYQITHLSPVTQSTGDVVGVLQLEQDNS